MIDTRAEKIVQPLSYPVGILLACFLSIAAYNVIEITVRIFTTFKKWRGLYFNSFLIATWSIMVHVAGHVLKLYNITSMNVLYNTLILFGWVGMVTGQSLVLYSRLHLLYITNKGRVRWVLYMIIFDAITCHMPGIVLVYGASNAPDPDKYIVHFKTYEIIQMTMFALQELIISGLYAYRVFRLLNSEVGYRGPHAISLGRHLLAVNITIIIMELSLLSVIYTGHYEVEAAYKPAVYSVKLKLEFRVLNDLRNLFSDGSRLGSATGSHGSCERSPNSNTTPTSSSGLQVQDTGKRNKSSASLPVQKPTEARVLCQPTRPVEQATSNKSWETILIDTADRKSFLARRNARKMLGSEEQGSSLRLSSKDQVDFKEIV
ncbi:hypothetical protein DM02DRAFT_654583 [Periconia macrospinosa]|uniref:DUF7703 domain-containing protein n=1 Tax=Periconia macrospinosa TaxID=97972 RepID=A0A2V1DTS7_9PLEO|nr:hypothetical protein DM02DRAFT_654583 [Periconia macrospinosa]